MLKPSNINCSQLVVFCRDNNDLMEETASADGTIPCTDGVVIQRQPDTHIAVDTGLQDVPTHTPTSSATRPQHCRSIQCIRTPAQEIHYVACVRVGPQRCEHRYAADGDSQCLEQLSSKDCFTSFCYAQQVQSPVGAHTW